VDYPARVRSLPLRTSISGIDDMTDDALLTFLQTHDAPYCFRCLAQAFPHTAVKQRLEAAKRAGAPMLIGDGRCAICTQVTTVVAWVTGDPDLARFSW
jgi:hypothetical protein